MFRRRAFINNTAQRVPRAKTSGVLRQDWENLDHGCCVSHPYLREVQSLLGKVVRLASDGLESTFKSLHKVSPGLFPTFSAAVYHGG